MNEIELVEDAKCEFTHYGACEGEVRFIADPFALEIYDETNMVWICDEHEDQRRQDT